MFLQPQERSGLNRHRAHFSCKLKNQLCQCQSDPEFHNKNIHISEENRKCPNDKTTKAHGSNDIDIFDIFFLVNCFLWKMDENEIILVWGICLHKFYLFRVPCRLSEVFGLSHTHSHTLHNSNNELTNLYITQSDSDVRCEIIKK